MRAPSRNAVHLYILTVIILNIALLGRALVNGETLAAAVHGIALAICTISLWQLQAKR